MCACMYTYTYIYVFHMYARAQDQSATPRNSWHFFDDQNAARFVMESTLQKRRNKIHSSAKRGLLFLMDMRVLHA